MNFGCTELIKGPFRAKYCEESAGDIRFGVAPQKPGKNTEKRLFETFERLTFIKIEVIAMTMILASPMQTAVVCEIIHWTQVIMVRECYLTLSIIWCYRPSWLLLQHSLYLSESKLAASWRNDVDHDDDGDALVTTMATMTYTTSRRQRRRQRERRSATILYERPSILSCNLGVRPWDANETSGHSC